VSLKISPGGEAGMNAVFLAILKSERRISSMTVLLLFRLKQLRWSHSFSVLGKLHAAGF
jgi:hypothetical protein